MADITFGIVGESDSYYPITRSGSRTLYGGQVVDIMRVPIGTSFRKFYFPTNSGDYDFVQDDLFIEPQ